MDVKGVDQSVMIVVVAIIIITQLSHVTWSMGTVRVMFDFSWSSANYSAAQNSPQCLQVDEDSLLSREWALWGMRNLCEGNEAIQQDLAQLKAQSLVDNQELEQAGIQLQIDHVTGKVRVVSRMN